MNAQTTRTCEQCSAEFTRKRKKNGRLIDRSRFAAQRYCSRACSAAGALTRLSAAERFDHLAARDAATGCWLWTGANDGRGYGRIGVNGTAIKAHRFSYESFVGPIPDGVLVDHVCRVTMCVNPSHLRLVTKSGNGQNRVAQVNSQTGHRNVFAQEGKWVAQVRSADGGYYRGTFGTMAEAAAAAEEARIRIHPNYVPGSCVHPSHEADQIIRDAGGVA